MGDLSNKQSIITKNQDIREKTLKKVFDGVYSVYDDINEDVGSQINIIKDKFISANSYGNNGTIELYGNINNIYAQMLNHDEGGFNEIDGKTIFTTNAEQNSIIDGNLPLTSTLKTRDLYLNKGISLEPKSASDFKLNNIYPTWFKEVEVDDGVTGEETRLYYQEYDTEAPEINYNDSLNENLTLQERLDEYLSENYAGKYTPHNPYVKEDMENFPINDAKDEEGDEDFYLVSHISNYTGITEIQERIKSKDKWKDFDGKFLSRGRALKTKDGNDFCRSWTRDKSYSTFKDTIRPFNSLSLEDVQKRYSEVYRPNEGGKRLNDMSVLQKNGLVNITPKRNESGELNAESVKKCMFSIENLAWKDVITPNKSAEQTGPNKGRIMWFPPYNLKFNEAISTQWQDNSFIGRGEKIYTYVNTERNGTLSFTLLIDHPSLINHYNFNNGSIDDDAAEQNLLRFFAGCDNDLEVLGAIEGDVKDKEGHSNDAVEKGDNLQEITAKVYFPNNYSGVDEKDPDDCIDYLFDGNGLNVISSCGYEDNRATQLSTPITGNCNGKIVKWYYKVDNAYVNQCLPNEENYKNTSTFKLNCTENSNTGYTFNFQDLYKAVKGVFATTQSKRLRNILFEQGKIVGVKLIGYATSDGKSEENTKLSFQRAQTISKWLTKYKINAQSPTIEYKIVTGNNVVNNKESKEGKCVDIVFSVEPKKEEVQGITGKTGTTNSIRNTDSREVKNKYTRQQIVQITGKSPDEEYIYFKEISESNSVTRDNIMEKVRYFTPAFHSITPEGFNARLTFLQQCTRQGPSSAPNGTGVSNLAFGRAPYCILRIGDFFNTKILIDSVSINYDNNGGVQWDLNPEGAGVQPMYADVSINFKFIGGTDISGPISRLQNAVSFNYYSNTSIYDNRADYRKGFIDDNKNNEVKYQSQSLNTETNK